jgi:glycosyltransferase involved in cell wall biosynthesis
METPNRDCPSVTVLMAVYNAERFLREAVDSVLGQTFTDFELLVVDDGSTDSTMNVLRGYSDIRIRVIGLPENQKLVNARNVGVREARGQLIACMDGDDIAEPSRLEKQVAYMNAHPGVVLLGTGFVWVDAEGHPFEETRFPHENSILQEKLLIGNYFCTSSIVMRADAARGVGGFRSVAGWVAEDYDLWLRLAETGDIANLPDLLLRYRVHERQLSTSRLVDMRRAANTYRALAKQRRAGAREDLEQAKRSAECSETELRRAVRADFLTWASRYFAMRRPMTALKLVAEAAWVMPLRAETWLDITRFLFQEFSFTPLGRRLRWYAKKLSSSA